MFFGYVAEQFGGPVNSQRTLDGRGSIPEGTDFSLHHSFETASEGHGTYCPIVEGNTTDGA